MSDARAAVNEIAREGCRDGMECATVMWSYPIIKDGLINVVDLRNGLYVLRYEGRFENEIEHLRFLEGNSNQLCFEPVARPPDDRD